MRAPRRVNDPGLAASLLISDAAARYGVTARAIRFYEDKGLISCGRNRRGARVLDPPTEGRLAAIIQLREAGLGVAEIAPILDEDRDLDALIRRMLRERLSLLDAERGRLAARLGEDQAT